MSKGKYKYINNLQNPPLYVKIITVLTRLKMVGFKLLNIVRIHSSLFN